MIRTVIASGLLLGLFALAPSADAGIFRKSSCENCGESHSGFRGIFGRFAGSTGSCHGCSGGSHSFSTYYRVPTGYPYSQVPYTPWINPNRSPRDFFMYRNY